MDGVRASVVLKHPSMSSRILPYHVNIPGGVLVLVMFFTERVSGDVMNGGGGFPARCVAGRLWWGGGGAATCVWLDRWLTGADMTDLQDTLAQPMGGQ